MPETKTRERIVVDQAHQLDYKTMRDIAKRCGGWMRSSSRADGESAEAWVDDKAYIFSGAGLIEFLYAIKDILTDSLYEAKDLVDYIEEAAKQPPSVFVRDAIVGRAREVKAKIEGKDGSDAF